MQYTTIEVRNERDVGNVVSMILEGQSVAFTIPMDVDREKNFRLMKVINDHYKDVVANSNRKSARVA